MDVNNRMLQEFEEFIGAQKGVAPEVAMADSTGQELKEKWLKILDDMVKEDKSGTLAQAVAQLNENADDIRAQIGKLVYEGKATKENVQAVLEEKNIGVTAQSNNCAVCAACSACVACSVCALCAITGIAVASVTSSITVTSTVSAVNS